MKDTKKHVSAYVKVAREYKKQTDSYPEDAELGQYMQLEPEDLDELAKTYGITQVIEYVEQMARRMRKGK